MIRIWEYLIQTIVLTVIYTWLFLGSNCSIMVAGLFHAMGNLTCEVIPDWVTESGRWLSFLLLIIPASADHTLWLSQANQEQE